MRRILLSSAATVSGVVLLLALKAPAPPWAPQQTAGDNPVAAAPPAPQAPPAAGGETAGGGQPPQGGGQDGQGAQEDQGGQGDQADQGGQGAARTRTVMGDVVRTQYGPVQARITLTGGRITAADAAQAPSGDAQTDSVTARAVPELGKRAVQAQNADIDTVSGATFTSEGYKTSLQSALDRAGG
ncbi:FMN-binding protein [Streptomyces zingiberis]|nr:FMN-binding protein [Streptomyces zingiberis]